jgi:hypothetical protein
MKLKILFFLILSIAVFTSCSDDDDPTYEWRTQWIVQTLDMEGTVIKTDTIFDGVQNMTNEDAKVVIRGSASTFMVSNVVEDVIQTEGDVKTRTILYNSGVNKLIYSHTKIK